MLLRDLMQEVLLLGVVILGSIFKVFIIVPVIFQIQIVKRKYLVLNLYSKDLYLYLLMHLTQIKLCNESQLWMCTKMGRALWGAVLHYCLPCMVLRIVQGKAIYLGRE